MWNESVEGGMFQKSVELAYKEVVKWKRNIFLVPSGKVGERFVDELSKMFRAYGESTAMEPAAITAAMTMPALLLQKPHPKSKVKDHVKCLERRLDDWKAGNISALLLEGRTIQQRIKRGNKCDHDDAIAKGFSKFMKQGKIRSALRLLSRNEGTLLDMKKRISNESSEEWTVLDELKSKHPPKGPILDHTILTDKTKDFHPIIKLIFLSPLMVMPSGRQP